MTELYSPLVRELPDAPGGHNALVKRSPRQKLGAFQTRNTLFVRDTRGLSPFAMALGSSLGYLVGCFLGPHLRPIPYQSSIDTISAIGRPLINNRAVGMCGHEHDLKHGPFFF